MAQALEFAQLSDFEAVYHASEKAQTHAELFSVIDAAIRSFGFPWFALVDDGDLIRGRSRCLLMTNYPSSWVDELTTNRLYRYDPVHDASIRSPTPLCWEGLHEIGRTSGRDR